ncbi:MAG: DUF1566 domain-containing protein, partial [Gammaproteobacteria bacterium]|nr:DUF1566 domain-containing protein [Gammaproteobacteria bacterium]
MNTIQHNLIVALSLCASFVIPNIASAVAISGQGTWETTLQGRDLDGNLATAEAYYDTSLNITWLANANYAMTSGYTPAYTFGMMTWAAANAWAAGLNPHGSGITGWRLPTTVDVGSNGCSSSNIYQGVDCGYNLTAHSEMSHMFYVTLGDKAYYSTSGIHQPGYGLSNTGPFSNLQSYIYWSATGYARNLNDAWYFRFDDGGQTNLDNTIKHYA